MPNVPIKRLKLQLWVPKSKKHNLSRSSTENTLAARILELAHRKVEIVPAAVGPVELEQDERVGARVRRRVLAERGVPRHHSRRPRSARRRVRRRRQEDPVRDRVLRRLGNTDGSESCDRDSDDRAGIYGAGQVEA